jgi:hypothetical protein
LQVKPDLTQCSLMEGTDKPLIPRHQSGLPL